MPFVWLGPNEIDIGGDSSRLYFYDPIAYLFSHTLWGISPSSFGSENVSYYVLPFNLLLIFFRSFLSPTLTIEIFHGFALASSFLFISLIIRMILLTTLPNVKKNSFYVTLSAVTGGILYILSPVTIQGWDKVILTHDQVFLNPIIFYLLLKYLITKRRVFALIALLITFIFSHNFNYTAAPPFFSFYPLAVLYLFALSKYIKKIRINWKEVVVFILIFLGLQSFHLIPQALSILTPTGAGNAALFSDFAKFSRGLEYFISIAPNIRVTLSLLGLPQMTELGNLSWIFILLPVIMIIGLFFTKSKVHLLTALFFLITLFLASANITSIGYEIYRKLFIIPGFSMFRNFYGQFAYVFLFFYVLLFAQSFYIFLVTIRSHKFIPSITGVFIIIMLVVNAIPFITGELVNKTLWQSKNVKIFMQPDPVYENAISYLRSLPQDGKVLTLPLSDPGYQIVMGLNNGAYQGPSTISYLTGKKDFSGIAELGQFQEAFLTLVRNKDYEGINNILYILNIKYVFYNSNPSIYEDRFPNFPYTEVRKFLPKTQDEYSEFIKNLKLKEIRRFGKIVLYQVNDADRKSIQLPRKFVPIVANHQIDWNYFVNDLNLAKEKVAILPSDKVSSTPSVIKTDKIDQSDLIVKDYPIEVVYPYVRWSVESPFYRIVQYREGVNKNNTTIPSEKINLHLSLATKRISELIEWGDEMDKSGWNASLERYSHEMDSAIPLLKTPNLDIRTKLIMTRKIAEAIKLHEIKLNEIISNKSNTSYYYEVVNKIFARLKEKISVNQNQGVQYIASGVGHQQSLEAVAVFDKEVADLIPHSYLIYNGIKIKPVKIDEKNRYVSYGEIEFNEENNVISLNLPKIHISDLSGWKLGKNVVMTKSSKIEPGDQLYSFSEKSDRQVLTRPLNNWEQKKRYKVSFDYSTYGKTYEFSLFLQGERRKRDKKDPPPTAVFRETRNTRSWNNFTIVIDSDNNNSAEFAITNIDGKDGRIAIRNYELIELPKTPSIQLKQKKVYEELQVPKHSITTINPTKYTATLYPSSKPTFLILPDSYNTNWKIYQSESDYSNYSKLNSFSPLRILDTKVFETLAKRPLDEANHFAANGYANAWIIPESNSKRTFIIEYTPQRTFYISLIISLSTLTLLLTLLLQSLIKRR